MKNCELKLAAPLLISIYAAAGLLGLSHFTIRSWCHCKNIATHKLKPHLMIPRSEINRILRESLQPRDSAE
jgi:hypothetical protein